MLTMIRMERYSKQRGGDRIYSFSIIMKVMDDDNNLKVKAVGFIIVRCAMRDIASLG